MIPIVTGVKMRHTSSLAVLCTLYIVYIQKLRKCAIVALAYDIGVEIGANSLIQENPCTRRNVDLRPYCQSKWGFRTSESVGWDVGGTMPVLHRS